MDARQEPELDRPKEKPNTSVWFKKYRNLALI